MTTNADPVRALIEKWRSESTSDDQSSEYECGEHDARGVCANELEYALAQQPAAPSAPVGVEAVRGAWLAAITLANNICVQESDRENDRDGDTGWINGTAECAKRIREYAHPTDAELLEMLDEAGANAAKAALSQRHAAPSGEAVAWLRMKPDGTPDWAEDCIGSDDKFLDPEMASDGYYLQPLYAAPQQPAGRVHDLAARLVDELDGLVGESDGVFGLHLNGDVAAWDELLPGGRFERLSSLDELRAALAAQQQGGV